jgi:hypothetical protein
MTTLNTFNICNKNNASDNLFDNIENRVFIIEKSLNEIKHIEFNYYKILSINETLINENEEFKKIIDMQNIKITNLENEINELKIENKEFKNEINELKIENKELKNKINILENDKFKNKIFEAITDMINTDNLDSKLNDISNDLIKIKTVRNSNSHYIKNIDSIDVKNKKKQHILSILKSLSTEYKEDMIYDYDWNNNIIDEIINYYETYTFIINSNNITKKDLERINNWWN